MSPSSPYASLRIDVTTFVIQSIHMDVGVRELKQHLSEYLERASRGETIRVTDRGEPRAIIGPIPGVLRLEQGIAEKWIRAGVDTPPQAVRRYPARMSSTQSVREDRGE
jgi:prevent-host-death family protein